MTGSLTSESTNVSQLDKATIRVVWTSADAIGELKIQAKQIANPQKPEEASDWFDLDFGNVIAIDMTVPTPDSEHQILFNELPFTDLRVVYTPTSGTGTIDSIKISAKQVGG